MGEVVELSQYVHRRDVAFSGSSEAPAYDSQFQQSLLIESSATGTDRLSPQVWRKLSPDTQLSRFLEVAEEAITLIEKCDEELAAHKNFSADDLFMAAKAVFAELLMLRDISDSVGLIALKCFQSAAGTVVVTDNPELPNSLSRALRRIWTAPFLDFNEACELAAQIEAAGGGKAVVGYNELANELLASDEDDDADKE